ncbi:hypothetical protein McPS_08420 [Marichromatium sp. PS1]
MAGPNRQDTKDTKGFWAWMTVDSRPTATRPVGRAKRSVPGACVRLDGHAALCPSYDAGSKWLVAGGWRLAAGGWWLVAGGWWLVAGGWWLVAGGWRLAAGGWRLEADRHPPQPRARML